MSLIHIHRSDSVVGVDPSSGRPREIRDGPQRMTVTAVESVRDETAAYPIGSGPRTLFIVRSGSERFRLVHMQRERRWLVEALDRTSGELITAA